jgi:hypothetical protein
MKKGVIFFALLLAGGFCFAQTDESYARVNAMLRSGLNKNFSAIQQEAFYLDEAQRLRLYNTHNMGSDNMWIGAALDFFLGLGIGNFYQKDYLGGGIALGGGLVGYGLVIGGYVVMVSEAYSALRGGSLGSAYDMIEHGLPFYIAGGVVLAASNTFGLVRTLIFPSSYNNKLRDALNIQGIVMNIEPSLNITGSEYELTLVHFRY